MLAVEEDDDNRAPTSGRRMVPGGGLDIFVNCCSSLTVDSPLKQTKEIGMDLEARLKALEARLEVLEDQEKIRECLSRYSFNADLGRSEEYVNNYTPDGVINLGLNAKWAGKDQLLDFIASPTGSHKTSFEGRCSDSTSMDYLIRVDGTKAWAEGYSVVFLRKGDKYEAATCGFNHWENLRRTVAAGI